MCKVKRIFALVLCITLILSIFAILNISAEEVQDADVEVEEEIADTSANSGITIYYKSEDCIPYIYYWNALPTNLTCDYPGVRMTLDTSQGDKWYKYTFPNSTKINMQFTNGSSELSGQISEEQSRTTGEWWFKNGKWRNSNPEKPDSYESCDMREDTIYFVITTRFYDGDTGNNVHCWDDSKANNPDTDPAWRGDFKGLADKLDYIKALGFSAIWITPVVENASGYDYHGYHALNFSKVDARYESSDFTYEDLIQAAHDKGMKIIQDVVWNHTGNFGETNLCNLFTKKYSKIQDLADMEKSMIPTQELLNAAGVSTAEQYWKLQPGQQYDKRLQRMKQTQGFTDMVSTSSVDNKNNYYHNGYWSSLNWDDYTNKYCQIAGDCVDLNTENSAVAKYTVDAYSNYLDMGVDGFRVDTVRHIPRLTLNKLYNKQMIQAAKDAGNENFYMFGEICCRYSQVWYREHPGESCQFYTWDESDPTWLSKYSMNTDPMSIKANIQLTLDHWQKYDDIASQPKSNNAFLGSNYTYHKPDYSKASGMGAIDFQMHWNFNNANQAFSIAKEEDSTYNDSTWNVVYVESHDYSPDNSQNVRYTGGTQAWAENLDLMFTFRGIPCLYYGGEVEFQAGQVIDNGPNCPLSTTGRAYFGDNITGSVTATDFSEYKNASGNVATTLNKPLAKHLQKLNAIRRAVPALQKGQYSIANGNMAFVKRYTDKTENIDSLALVTISDGATFSGVPNGKYIDAVTGDVKNVTNGTLTVSSPGKANMRVYVCCASGFTGITGAVGPSSGQSYLK